jgi:2-polyprenyl-3-methyl-5-hydroxy-6-metoxy-1,4-benzoquinol methylase
MDITKFLEQCASTAYPEPESILHSKLSEMAFKHFFGSVYQPPKIIPVDFKPKVLDVGCGSGFMSTAFSEKGWEWDGITLDQSVVDKFSGKWDGPLSLNVQLEDMHGLSDESWLSSHYDLIWARHVLEHSPIPFKVLLDFKRIVKQGGYIYIEVPAPNTQSFHCMNPNHYSCFDMNGWVGLIAKAGLEIVDYKEFTFVVEPPGREKYHEMYYCFYIRRSFEN